MPCCKGLGEDHVSSGTSEDWIWFRRMTRELQAFYNIKCNVGVRSLKIFTMSTKCGALFLLKIHFSVTPSFDRGLVCQRWSIETRKLKEVIGLLFGTLHYLSRICIFQ